MQKKNVYSEIYGNARCFTRQGEGRLALDFCFLQPPIPPTENNAAARERVTRKQPYASRSRLVPLTHIPPAQEHVRTELGARRKWRLHFAFTQGGKNRTGLLPGQSKKEEDQVRMPSVEHDVETFPSFLKFNIVLFCLFQHT